MQKSQVLPLSKDLKTPSVEVDGKYIPDLHSRYFTADFSYDLSIIRKVAGFAGVKTPYIDEMASWYDAIAIEKNEFRYSTSVLWIKRRLIVFI